MDENVKRKIRKENNLRRISMTEICKPPKDAAMTSDKM